MVQCGLEQRRILVTTKDRDHKIDQKSELTSWATCNNTEVIGGIVNYPARRGHMRQPN